ncbi:hypothetical protein D1BOALGB6SA_4338 [Olavius sp. associated proteobacterium Delta 1]|nr:hypothetical protein D1BOALGB6SA_4338 [Olavius sp. associated proteobacterium Delta 1]
MNPFVIVILAPYGFVYGLFISIFGSWYAKKSISGTIKNIKAVFAFCASGLFFGVVSAFGVIPGAYLMGFNRPYDLKYAVKMAAMAALISGPFCSLLIFFIWRMKSKILATGVEQKDGPDRKS